MDKTVRPQDDFFMFCNGTWVKNNPVPETESRWGSFNELEQSNKEKLKDILLAASQAKAPKSSPQQIVGDYYTAFMNMEKRNALGYAPIKNDLAAIAKAKAELEAIEKAKAAAKVVTPSEPTFEEDYDEDDEPSLAEQMPSGVTAADLGIVTPTETATETPTRGVGFGTKAPTRHTRRTKGGKKVAKTVVRDYSSENPAGEDLWDAEV
jgi:predicted metalloendopeptidase